MTTEMIILLIFCAVDDGLGKIGKERNARLYPSEVVTIGILFFALKGGHFRAFYRWLKRDYDVFRMPLGLTQLNLFSLCLSKGAV